VKPDVPDGLPRFIRFEKHFLATKEMRQERKEIAT
jgi:hypothetical protein